MNIFPFLTLKANTKYLLGNSSVRQALEKMDFYKFTVVPLLDGKGKYLGTLSEGDLISFIKNECSFDIKRMEESSVMDIVRYRSYKPLNIEARAEELVNLSMEQNFIPIVDDRNTFIGIIRRKAIIEHFYSQIKDSLENEK